MRGLWLAAGVVLVPAAAQAADLQDAATARAFVERIYADYARDSGHAAIDDDFATIFEPQLASAMQADGDAAAAAGEMGKLEADPFCQCQDWEPFTAQVGDVYAIGDTAKVTVRFHNFDDRAVTLDLVETSAGWRVSDVTSGDFRLRALFLGGRAGH